MPDYLQDDTIAAEATPPGRGGISVVRLSGKRAFDIAGALLNSPLPDTGRHKYTLLADPLDKQAIDEAIVNCYSAGNSYTGEDSVELSVHGSPVVVLDLLDVLYRQGARPAEPGEFTLRAFLNGRLDLTQAESVADLISARSHEAAQMALKRLSGDLRTAVESLENDIERLLMLYELELDFVEEDVELSSEQEKLLLIDRAIASLEQLIDGYSVARRLREGVYVVITGAPNVGKSSLFNALLGNSRAIVHPTPGTTRDVLQSTFMFNGVAFELFDTSGIRTSTDEIEDEGVRRAVETTRKADVVILLSSVDLPVTPQIVQEDHISYIRVINKVDLQPSKDTGNCIPVSAMKCYGIEQLKKELLRVSVGSGLPQAAAFCRERHIVAAGKARKALITGRLAMIEGRTGEVIAEDFREALLALGEITGHNRVEGLLDSIFSRFCIGK